MPDITTDEQLILTRTEQKIRDTFHKGKAEAKLDKQETAVLASLQAEFEASPGSSSAETVRAVIEKAIEENPVKKGLLAKVGGAIADEAKRQGLNVNVGGGVRVNAGRILGGGGKNDPKLDSNDLVAIATAVYAEAEARNPAPKTLEEAFTRAAQDSVLSAQELQKLAKNPKFVELLKGRELAIVNFAGTAKDEILVGGEKGTRLKLSDLELTIGNEKDGGFPLNTPTGTKKTVIVPGTSR